ncbi:MAG: DUF3343 domain-containing protein [Planctomycetota bacterium]|nr:DUF3343 domain-containing protein [Planctomycetota bacterium]
MQKKDEFCVLLFSSVHYVFRAEKALREAGIRVETITAPRELTSDCGVALLLKQTDSERALSLLKENKIPLVSVSPYKS